MWSWFNTFSKIVCMKKILTLILDLNEVKPKFVCPCNQNCIKSLESTDYFWRFQMHYLVETETMSFVYDSKFTRKNYRKREWDLLLCLPILMFWSRMSVLHSHKFPLPTCSCSPGVLCYLCFAHKKYLLLHKNKCILSLSKGLSAVGIEVSLDHSERFSQLFTVSSTVKMKI